MLRLKMKVVATTILVVMPLAGSAYAQPKQPSKVVEANRKANIIIGTTNLSLGMPKDFVLPPLAAQFDMKPVMPRCDNTPPCRMYLISNSELLVGSLQFDKNGNLIAVSKNWAMKPTHYTEGEIVNVLVALFASLITEGHGQCSLQTSQEDYLDYIQRVATMECQSKRVDIKAVRIQGDDWINISEEMGTWEH